ncbi:MAG: cheB, two-component system, chemotaxis family, response regulator CheB [Bryobacterales bacterium]|nr:cheB, two-component system, chemotaxis family, response regulator CheB [Bryobacterales bacterium]
MVEQNIVVVGASAGGIDALQKLVTGLPESLDAAVFVVLHTSPTHPTSLAEILSRAGDLPAVIPKNGDSIQNGKIYVAPTNRHLMVSRDRIEVVFGPRENLFRPAIDPLFRSAAATCRGRLIGIILSGGLDDGCRGLSDVEKAGGTTIVQDPADAEVPALPENALRSVNVDFKLPVSEIPDALVRALAQAPAPVAEHLRPEHPEPGSDPNAETGATAPERSGPERPAKEVGSVSPSSSHLHRGQPGFDGITCPECHGPICEDKDGPLRFRCIVGHSFSPQSMRAEHARRLENALWSAIAGFEEHATILRRLAAASGNGNSHDDDLLELEEEARLQDSHARELRALMEKIYRDKLASKETPESVAHT